VPNAVAPVPSARLKEKWLPGHEDAGARAAGDRRQTGVGGQVPGGRKRGDVADFEQDPGCGPDPDTGYRDQDRGKRVGIKHPLDLDGDLFALLQQLPED